MKFVAAAAFVFGAGLASAQNLSSTCQSTLTNLAASPDASCLNAAGLITAALGASSSSGIITPVNSWLSGMCSQAACSNSTIATLVNNVTSGCASDLESFGLSTNDSSSIVPIVQLAYPIVRQVVCLQDTSDNSTFCVSETLTNLQSSVGTLTLSNIVSLVSDAISGSSSTSISSNVTCSDCTKEAYNIVNNAYPSLVSGVASTVESQCGASFTDGASPSAITEVANTASPSSSSSSGSSMTASVSGGMIGLAASTLVAIFSALAFLA